MQEIVLILSSLAGVATAAAVRKMPRDKNQLLSLGASSHIKSQISALKIEKDILTKTISRLYQADAEFSKIQKDKLLSKYQHQLGVVLAKLEKLEQASNHPDLGPVGDGLITLMDQKLSKLDDRLYQLSSKMSSPKVETIKNKEPKVKEEPKQNTSKTFNFDKGQESQIKPTETPSSKSRQSFELTTLTNVSRKEPKFPWIKEKEETKQVVKPIPEPSVTQTELIKSKEDINKEIIRPESKVEEKIKIVQSIPPSESKTNLETKLDINKEVKKITQHKALPGPTRADDDFDEDLDDDDDLDKIKGDIMKALSKLEQVEVE